MQFMLTFDAGDHSKVKPLLYTHHGIYVINRVEAALRESDQEASGS